MKIFISWSGERSKLIAAAFKDWIPSVIQAARPYFSPSDIDKGSRWSNEISKELEAAKVGLICLTKENLNAPWLMFEAGALSKSLEKSRVYPMLFGIEPSDLTGPLVQFQATVFSKEEVLKFIKTVNQQLDGNALDAKVIDSVFEKWWPDLEVRVLKALENGPPARDANVRSEREILEEVLALARTLATQERGTQPHAEKDIVGFSSARSAGTLMALIEYSEVLQRTATQPELLREFRVLVMEIMRTSWSALSEGQKGKLGKRLGSLVSALDQRASELEDEIPF